MFFGHFLATKKFQKPLYKIDNENTVVSVLVSVSAETENHFRFRYRFRQKRNMAILACFGFSRNKKSLSVVRSNRSLECQYFLKAQYFLFCYQITRLLDLAGYFEYSPKRIDIFCYFCFKIEQCPHCMHSHIEISPPNPLIS